MKTAILMSMVALLCAACAAPPTQVVLLPQPGGAGAVEVSTAAASQRIDRGYAEATVQAGLPQWTSTGQVLQGGRLSGTS